MTNPQSTADRPTWASVAGRRGRTVGEAAQDLLRRTVVTFAAAYFFAATFGFNFLGQPLWTIIRRFDDSAVALIPVGISLLSLVASLGTALLSKGLRWERFAVAMAVAGILLDLAGAAIFGLDSVVSRGLFLLHISACTVMAVFTITMLWAKSAYPVGVLLVVYAFLATPANPCRVPGHILGAEYNPERSLWTVVTRQGARVESYIVAQKCVDQSGISPELVLDGYKSYNIILVSGHYYGIGHRDGTFRLTKYLSGGYSHGVDAPSLEEVKQRIDALWPSLPPIPDRSERSSGPQLALEGYRGYNVFRMGDEFYGIRQADEAFDVERFRTGGYTLSFTARSLGDVKQLIDASLEPVPTYDSNPIIEEQKYRGFNIIFYRGKFYAIPQPEGEFDIQRTQAGGYSKSFAGSSLTEIKLLMDSDRSP
jgi:hypothetical protein